MEFEWDEAKAVWNKGKHGVPFVSAGRIFLDPHRLDDEDSRRNYNEERRIALGTIGERVFVVVYTPREKMIRLISARKANEREQRQYDEALSSRSEEPQALD